MKATHSPSIRAALWLLLSLVIAGCGGDRRAPSSERPMPDTPAAALAWILEAQASGGEALRRQRIAAWPLDDPEFATSEATRVVLTWRIIRAVNDGRFEEAARLHELLAARFEGEGESPVGVRRKAPMMRLAICIRATVGARRRMEGSRPDLEGARAALDIARRLLDPEHPGEALLVRDVKLARQWVELESARELLEACRVRHVAPAQPCAFLFADDYTLGEIRVRDALERWGDSGLRVRVIPILRGQVRMGLRRVPAESREAELEVIAARCRAAKLELASVEGGGVEPERIGAWCAAEEDEILIVVDAEGRIRGRLSGQDIDPGELESVVQKLLSR